MIMFTHYTYFRQYQLITFYKVRLKPSNKIYASLIYMLLSYFLFPFKIQVSE